MDTKVASQAEKNKRIPLHQRLSFWVTILVLLIMVGLFKSYVKFNQSQLQKKQLLPVVLAKAYTQDVPIYISALGNVIPTYSVIVRTQINGILMRVLFKEGQMVKTGDLLAQIDDRPYLAQLTEYQGQYERDKAQLVNALIDLKRYQTLWKQDSVSQQTLATQQALVKQLQGTLKLDRGLLQATNVNLIYTKITAPINGRIGLRFVDPGNFVQTSDTSGIAIINMLNPITVVFTLSEDTIPSVLEQMQINGNKSLVVEAFDRQQNKRLAVGKLLTMDNQIDTNTGTVKLKALFQNNKNTLFPNQFVNIRLLVKVLPHAVIVPTAAIQHQPQGSFVYVFNPDQTVRAKAVVVDMTLGDRSAIRTGILPGQLVVVEGADKLTDGAKVIDATTQSSAHVNASSERHAAA